MQDLQNDLEDLKRLRDKAKVRGRFVGYLLFAPVALTALALAVPLYPVSTFLFGLMLAAPLYLGDFLIRTFYINQKTRVYWREALDDRFKLFPKNIEKGSPIGVFLKNAALGFAFASPLGWLTKPVAEMGVGLYNALKAPAPGKKSFFARILIDPDKVESKTAATSNKVTPRRLQDNRNVSKSAPEPAAQPAPKRRLNTTGHPRP